jgi:hypothetical protein
MIHELEEPEVQRQSLLRDPPMRTEPAPKQRPEPLQRVDVHRAQPIAVVAPGRLTRRMTDRLVAVAPFGEPGVEWRTRRCRSLSPGQSLVGAGRRSSFAGRGQPPDDDPAATRDSPQDRRLLLRQGPTTTLPFRRLVRGFSHGLGAALMTGHHVDLISRDRADEHDLGRALDDPLPELRGQHLGVLGVDPQLLHNRRVGEVQAQEIEAKDPTGGRLVWSNVSRNTLPTR